ncbi:DNA-directed RNA polymerase subunit delta [Amphibacillus cookii]|uniref:DNA-directed RNA polymerase subunit delta n=1 Tax=Amphibacillus cookii TaxID=767787 RepID=UPI0019589831|nr:DNA-directed RNA polymerase subunit delta [Amphibacillus cookii]
MSLAELNLDEQQEHSMIELATKILERENKALNYKELFDEVAELKGFSKVEKEAYIAQFYTDLNLDGRFLTIGSGQWGLKIWYPVEQIDEDITTEPKKKKKKKKRKTTKKEVEPSIDETDEDLTEVPLDFVEDSYDDDEDEIDLGDDIAEEDLEDSFDEDEEDYDEDLEEDEDEEDEEDDRK